MFFIFRTGANTTGLATVLMLAGLVAIPVNVIITFNKLIHNFLNYNLIFYHLTASACWGWHLRKISLDLLLHYHPQRQQLLSCINLNLYVVHYYFKT